MDKKPKTVLVVDDDSAILEVTKIILESEGYKVVTAPDRGTMTSLMRRQRPDVILLDIWLRGDNGADIARELRKKGKTKQIPIIIISASFDGALIASQAGADCFLAKPFTVDDLLSQVGKYAQYRNNNLL